MATAPFQIRRGISVAVRLVEADDAGYVAVNSQHFALKGDQTIEVNGALQLGPNKLRLIVRNTGSALPIGGRLPGGPWHGRFELYINGVLAGAYADSGNDGVASKEHIIADVEFLVASESILDESASKQSVSWFWKMFGY